ncbi:MAG: DUF433 domain-containing protein [Candidatus Sumerlaeota bacterium]|nr:DUF433 domain-containing protein [Candidatus Sumerlaeota bacterium]
MTPAFTAEAPPLSVDAEGVIRMGSTRVTLDTVVDAFLEGATAEEIAQQYPALRLADVYSVLGYYLRRQAEIDSYLQQRRTEAQALRAEVERRWEPAGVRARLLARRQDGGG